MSVDKLGIVYDNRDEYLLKLSLLASPQALVTVSRDVLEGALKNNAVAVIQTEMALDDKRATYSSAYSFKNL